VAAGDGVELGRQEALVATAQSAGQDERASAVQYLRGLIQSGQYQVDSSALSESIVTASLHGA
jgi:anti-sigma28 factor (negative regulator of flagellin synthesis)